MKVSSSKFTLLSLIAISALVLGGSGALLQSVDGAAVTFTAAHINSTATKITFSENVNGTMTLGDWGIDIDGSRDAGDITYDVAITDVNNGTAPSAANIVDSKLIIDPSLGRTNDTSVLYLRHDAIPTDVTYYINYTANPLKLAHIAEFHEARLNGAAPSLAAAHEIVEIGFNATAADWMAPTVVRAFTTSDQTFKVEMSETVVNVNATALAFDISGSDEVPGIVSANNGTKFLTFKMQNPIDFRSTMTLSYDTSYNGLVGTVQWITDGINTEQYGAAQQSDVTGLGVGNQMINFTGLTIDNDVNAENETCYDCSPPVLSNVLVSISGNDYIVYSDDPLHIAASEGDSITYSLTFTDNKGASNIPFAGIYTNFNSGVSHENNFYRNNFDSATQMSTSYYEWNTRSDDIAYDITSSIGWNGASSSVDSITGDLTLEYTMTIENDMASSEIWVDVADASGNYLKQAIPVTLEVAGDPSLTFASSENQKVTSFFNDSVLLTILGAFDTSSDNSSELSSALGIEDGTLPSWTTQLASWAVEDKIDVADMVIAVEYVINQ